MDDEYKFLILKFIPVTTWITESMLFYKLKQDDVTIDSMKLSTILEALVAEKKIRLVRTSDDKKQFRKIVNRLLH